jgi:hypothetical protein
MAETIKCPSCGFESESTAKRCACGLSLVAALPKPELDHAKSLDVTIITNLVRSIDASLKTITNIMFWWLTLSIAATILYVFANSADSRVEVIIDRTSKRNCE